MRKAKLTKKLVDGLKPRAVRYEVFDDEIKGFFVRVYPNGRRVFFVFYRTKDGQRRKPQVGEYNSDTFKVETAREKAKEMLSRANLGHDPSAERKEARITDTFAAFAEQYMKDAAAGVGREKPLKPRTVTEYWFHLRIHILPVIGSKKLTSIRPMDIQHLIRRASEKRIATVEPKRGDKKHKTYERHIGGTFNANRTLALLHAIFRSAESLRLIPAGTDPSRGFKLLKEKPRKRFLSADELQRLGAAIEACESKKAVSPWAAAAVRLLLFTGARRNEILSCQWGYVDACARCLRLPDSKTGEKIVRLNGPATAVIERLAQIKTEGNPWIIEGKLEGGRLVNIAKAWGRICKAAQLEDLRIHDLRHCFGGTGASLGLGLTAVGQLLGHTQSRTTLRYSDMAPDPLQGAAEAIGEALAAAMANGKAKVIQLDQSVDVVDAAKGGKRGRRKIAS